MSKTPGEKRLILVARTAAALGVSETTAEALLRTPRQQSLRVNTLRANPAQIVPQLAALGWEGESYSWLPEGLSVTSPLESVRDSQLVAEGKVFIQNAASWLPVLALDAQPGEAVLDVCAAPGGKASHVAARTNNQARIWANDNSRARLAKMRATLERLGVQVTQLTLFDATQLARKLHGQSFKRILLDAPCSGEGLMQLDRDKDFTSWSVAQIKRLQQLQKRILGQAWQLLEPGGTLVYSTCTMAPEENEAVIDYFLRSHEDAAIEPWDIRLPNRTAAVTSWNGKPFSSDLSRCLRLAPSPSIEAFFVCKLRKNHV